MNMAVALICLMALAVPDEVTGFSEQEHDGEIHSQTNGTFNIFQESRVDIQLLKQACEKLGGRCVKNKDCPNGLFHETKPGGPHCSKHRYCCNPGCVYGFKSYPNTATIRQGCYEFYCRLGYWKINSDDCLEPCSGHNFLVTVKTGDGLNAGANSNLHIVFEDHYGKSTKQFKISDSSRGHLKRGGTDEHRVPIPKGFGRTATLKIALDNKEKITKDWYCDHIVVEDPRDNNTFYFPIHRRFESNLMYEIKDDDKCLIPQRGPTTTIQDEYQFAYTLTAAMVKNLPRDEHFSLEYSIEFGEKAISLALEKLRHFLTWELHHNITKIYYGDFPLPESFQFWREDAWFGAQRVQGLLPNIIELCSKIPDKLGVTEDTVNELLEDSTLQQALDNKKIFITDLHLLDGIEYKKNSDIDHASPIALFYLNKKKHLMPIAIQLWQKKGLNNPIYTPKDQPRTWLVAKMFSNNAEAQLHEIVHHLSYTHLIMDGIAASMNRQLVSSHPVYRLLKPHFRFMMQINKLAEIAISSPGGSLDLFSIGTEGTKRLVAKAVPLFTFERAIGSVESDARALKVWDKQVLPDYPFRDDAATIYNITKKYVTTILNDCYGTSIPVSNDKHLQNYHAELVKSREQNGVGILGLPGSNSTGFSDIGEVIDMVTMFIMQCSVGHSTVNFLQYETYGYMPNYPADMNEAPPIQKVNYTEAEMMGLLPDMKNWLDIMQVTKLLSWDGTKELGDYVEEYCTDPVCREALKEYRRDLSKFSLEVKLRNMDRTFPYKYLDPEYVPNAISI